MRNDKRASRGLLNGKGSHKGNGKRWLCGELCAGIPIIAPLSVSRISLNIFFWSKE